MEGSRERSDAEQEDRLVRAGRFNVVEEALSVSLPPYLILSDTVLSLWCQLAGPPTMALKCLIQTAENLAKMSGVSGLPEGPVCPDFIRPSAFQKRFVRTLYSALSQPQNRENRSKTPPNAQKRAKYVLETIVGVLDADNLM